MNSEFQFPPEYSQVAQLDSLKKELSTLLDQGIPYHEVYRLSMVAVLLSYDLFNIGYQNDTQFRDGLEKESLYPKAIRYQMGIRDRGHNESVASGLWRHDGEPLATPFYRIIQGVMEFSPETGIWNKDLTANAIGRSRGGGIETRRWEATRDLNEALESQGIMPDSEFGGLLWAYRYKSAAERLSLQPFWDKIKIGNWVNGNFGIVQLLNKTEPYHYTATELGKRLAIAAQEEFAGDPFEPWLWKALMLMDPLRLPGDLNRKTMWTQLIQDIDTEAGKFHVSRWTIEELMARSEGLLPTYFADRLQINPQNLSTLLYQLNPPAAGAVVEAPANQTRDRLVELNGRSVSDLQTGLRLQIITDGSFIYTRTMQGDPKNLSNELGRVWKGRLRAAELFQRLETGRFVLDPEDTNNSDPYFKMHQDLVQLIDQHGRPNHPEADYQFVSALIGNEKNCAEVIAVKRPNSAVEIRITHPARAEYLELKTEGAGVDASIKRETSEGVIVGRGKARPDQTGLWLEATELLKKHPNGVWEI